MAPIRRYLRITPYTILETRIYLEDPYSTSWLLNPRSDVLPRIMTAVKPHVFRQLRDEKERAKGKSKKKKGVKDLAVEEDFEAAVFLTDVGTRHSVCVKVKDFERKRRQRLGSKENKLTGWLGEKDRPLELDDDGIHDEEEQPAEQEDPVILQESDEELPIHDRVEVSNEKRRRGQAVPEQEVSDDEGFIPTQARSHGKVAGEDGNDDKKKMALNLSYDGFSIYGKILCLVVKRRKGRASMDAPADGRQMLETWVSTQAAQEPRLLDD